MKANYEKRNKKVLQSPKEFKTRGKFNAKNAHFYNVAVDYIAGVVNLPKKLDR